MFVIETALVLRCFEVVLTVGDYNTSGLKHKERKGKFNDNLVCLYSRTRAHFRTFSISISNTCYN